MQLKVLSWNIWCGVRFEEVVSYLKSADADIIALQEVVEDENGNFAERIAKELGYEFVSALGMKMPRQYIWGHENEEGLVPFGTAILSKYPIVGSEVCELSANPSPLAIRADIDVKGIVIHAFSLHLKHSHKQEPLAIQDEQVDALLALAPRDKTIVMGDFNMIPERSGIEKMNQVMQATDTANIPTWPQYREGCPPCELDTVTYKIDYIFTSNDFKSSEYQVGETKASDHLPISVILNTY
jgi:endonuclease/exonuclease/phosphatase family metal-dependent hydrolase